MIQNNELRIGNYIRYEGKGFFIVRRISHDDIEGVWVDDGVISTDNDSPEAFEPIPLTPELLEKVGFEEDTVWPDMYGGRRWERTVGDMAIELISITVTASGDTYSVQFWPMEEGMECKSLHQLQNLFFALKGTELELSL
jgi:hypothetical protein